MKKLLLFVLILLVVPCGIMGNAQDIKSNPMTQKDFTLQELADIYSQKFNVQVTVDSRLANNYYFSLSRSALTWELLDRTLLMNEVYRIKTDHGYHICPATHYDASAIWFSSLPAEKFTDTAEVYLTLDYINGVTIPDLIERFSSVLKFDYVIDRHTTGIASTSLKMNIPCAQAWGILDRFLWENDVRMVEKDGVFWVTRASHIPPMVPTAQPVVKTPLTQLPNTFYTDTEHKIFLMMDFVNGSTIPELVGIFSSYLDMSFTVDKEVTGLTSVYVAKEMSRAQIWRFFNTLMHVNNAYVVEENGVLWVRPLKHINTERAPLIAHRLIPNDSFRFDNSFFQDTASQLYVNFDCVNSVTIPELVGLCSQHLKFPFVVDKSCGGVLTLSAIGEMNRQQIWEFLAQVLRQNQAFIYEDAGVIWIVPRTTGKSVFPQKNVVGMHRISTPGKLWRVFNLSYLHADTVAALIEKEFTPKPLMAQLGQSKLFIYADLNELSRYEKFIRKVDQPDSATPITKLDAAFFRKHPRLGTPSVRHIISDEAYNDTTPVHLNISARYNTTEKTCQVFSAALGKKITVTQDAMVNLPPLSLNAVMTRGDAWRLLDAIARRNDASLIENDGTIYLRPGKFTVRGNRSAPIRSKQPQYQKVSP